MQKNTWSFSWPNGFPARRLKKLKIRRSVNKNSQFLYKNFQFLFSRHAKNLQTENEFEHKNKCPVPTWCSATGTLLPVSFQLSTKCTVVKALNSYIRIGKFLFKESRIMQSWVGRHVQNFQDKCGSTCFLRSLLFGTRNTPQVFLKNQPQAFFKVFPHRRIYPNTQRRITSSMMIDL